MLKHWRNILLIVGSLIVLVTWVVAQGDDENIVIPESIFVRSGPAEEYAPVGALFSGDVVYPRSRSADGQWLLIAYRRGFGWIERNLVDWADEAALDDLPVLAANVTPTSDRPPTATAFIPTATPAESYVLLDGAEAAFVRAGPGRGYLRLGQLLPGATVEPFSRNEDTTWIMIRYEDEFVEGFAWIARSLVEWQDEETLEDLPIIPTDALTPTLTFTPSPTQTATATATDTPTETETATASATPTATDTATSTPTPTETDTATMTATATNTATYTPTEVPSETNTATATPTDTDTPQPTSTDTATSTPTPTETDTATHPPTEAPSETNTATATPTDTDTPQPTATDTATSEATEDVSVSGQVAAAATDTPEPTATNTDTPTAVPTASETSEPTGTATPEPSVTDTPEPTNTNTLEPSATNTDTPQPTAEETETSVAAVTFEETAEATEAPAVIALPETAIPSPTPDEPVAISPEETPDGGFSLPLEAIVGGLILLAIFIYLVLYAQGAIAARRYADGFVIEECPVCQRGALHLEERTSRIFGIPRTRFAVRCDECRSVLREKSPRIWYYSVDRLENPALYERYNGREITDGQLQRLLNQTATAPGRPKPPEFVDGELDNET